MKNSEILMNKDELKELIRRRRRQLTVHSFLYYQLNTNIISDSTFDTWSMELAELQNRFPEIAGEVELHIEFLRFDGSSGFDLPYHYPKFQAIGRKILKLHKEKTSGK